ncbi:MAG TPA: hypothetical protein VIV61_12635 [Candidatus Ozemobacteraceae bacterium]
MRRDYGIFEGTEDAEAMGTFLVESLSQKFELKSYHVFFDIKDSLAAEEILDYLDRGTQGLKQVFSIDADPPFEVYIYPDLACIERVTRRPMGMGETSRMMLDEGALLLSAQHLPKNIGEEVLKSLCYSIFNRGVKEREIGIMQMRTPSWLREGICLQVPYKARRDASDFLIAGWNSLQEANKTDQLIKPGLMLKNINFIPDPARRRLAQHQAFYMVRLLLSTYSDKFFKRYSTLMGAFEDMESEAVFRQCCNLDYEKFFSLFKDWVRTTNAWAAASD